MKSIAIFCALAAIVTTAAMAEERTVGQSPWGRMINSAASI